MDMLARARMLRLFGCYLEPQIPAWLRPAGDRPLAQRMEETARELSERINAGLLDHCDLRALSIAISVWAEAVAEAMAPPVRRRPWWRQLVK